LAIVSLGGLGTGQAKAAGTTITVTNILGSVIPAGSLLVVVGTWDNINSVTAPTITCSTIGGATAIANHATAVGSGVTTTAGAGIWHQCFRALTTADIAIGATICTLTSNQSAVARAGYCEGWTGVSDTLRGTVVTATSTAGTPTATTGGTAPALGDLVIGCASYENSSIQTGDADTTNGSWDAANGFGTSGSSGATNVMSSIQFKAITAGGAQTFNPSGSNDAVVCVFALTAGITLMQGAVAMTAPSTLAVGGTKQTSGAVAMTAPSTLTSNARVPSSTPFATTVSGRNILDQFGQPYFMSAYHQWNLIGWGGGRDETGVGTTTPHSAFNAVGSAIHDNGHNAILVLSITSTANGETGPFLNGNTWDAVAPWASGVPGNLNEAYWARVDDLIDTMAGYGITVYLFLQSGYTVATGTAFVSMTAGQATTFGTNLANRYKDKENIVWGVGADYYDDQPTQVGNMLAAMRTAGDTHLFSMEWMAESSSTVESGGTTPGTIPGSGISFSDVYSYNAAAFEVRHAWTHQTKPVYMSNGHYYQGVGAAEAHLMSDLLGWAFTSGSQGFYVGSTFTWENNAGYLAYIQTTDTWPNVAHPAMISRLTSIPRWHTLVPDLSSTFITSARGTDTTAYTSGGSGAQYDTSDAQNTYITAAVAADGKLGMLYIPSSRTGITIDTSKLVSTYDVYWIDPHNGNITTTTVAGSYNTPGNNSNGTSNWYLVFQEATSGTYQGAAAMTAPSALVVGGFATRFAVATMTAASALTVVGFATQPAAVTMTAPSALAVAGFATRPAAVTMTASSTLTSDAVRTKLGAVAMTAPSTLTSDGLRTTFPAVEMTAPSALVADATIVGGSTTYQGAVAMTAASVLTIAGVRETAATVAMTASSALTTAGVRDTAGSVAITVPSTLTVTAFATRPAVVAMTSASLLVTAATLTEFGAVSMNAPSTLTTAGVRTTFGTVSMTIPSTLAVVGFATRPAAVVMTVPSTLSSAAFATYFAAAAMTVPSALVTAGVRTTAGTVAMTIPSALTSDAVAGSSSFVSMTAPVTLSVNGFKTAFGSVNMTIPSVATFAAVRTAPASISMTAAAVLTVAAIRATAAVVSMANASSLTVAARATVFAAVFMQAASALVANATISSAPGTASPFFFWNGSLETPLSMKYYNGTVEVDIESYEIA
jgi:hypothetical protein